MPDIFDTLATTNAKPQGDVFDQLAAKKTDVFDELATAQQPAPVQRDLSAKRAGEAVLKGAASAPFVLKSGVQSAVGALAEGVSQVGQNISRNVRGLVARAKYGVDQPPPTVNQEPVLGKQLNTLQRIAEGGRDAAETTMEDSKSGILKPSTGLEKALSGEFSQSSDPVSRALYGATQSVLPNVIGGPLGAGKSIAFLQTLSEAAPGYWAARDNGKDPIEALTYAGVSGTGTFFLEKLGLDAIAGRLPAAKAAMDKLGQSYIANAALAFAAEGTTEGLQQIYQNAVAKGYDDTIEVFQGVLESVVVGGLAGGMASPVTTAINRAQATDAPIPGVSEADQAQAKELVAGGLDPATVAAWSQAPDETTKQQILTDALKPPAPEQPLGEPTVQGTPPLAEKSVASAPPPLPGAAAIPSILPKPKESLDTFMENRIFDLGKDESSITRQERLAIEKEWEDANVKPTKDIVTNLPKGARIKTRLDEVWQNNGDGSWTLVSGAKKSEIGRELSVENLIPSFHNGTILAEEKGPSAKTGIVTSTTDADALQAMTDDISRTRKPVPPDQFSIAEPPPDRAEEVSAVNQATALLGKKVVWFKNNKPENIRFNGTLTDDTIFINVDAKQPYVKIAMHESLHRMKTEQPDLYSKFMAVVKTQGSGFDKFRDELLSAYKAQGIAVDESSDWVWEELAADTLGDRGQDPTFWRDLYNKSPEAVKAIVDTIQKVLSTLSANGQTPEVAKYFQDFQKVHDAAVSVMSEYAAARSTDASLTQQGSPAVSTEAAANSSGVDAEAAMIEKAKQNGFLSVTSVQRSLKIGYERAVKVAESLAKQHGFEKDGTDRYTLPASKKAKPRKPSDTTKTNPALEAWRDETRAAGIRPDPAINEADMGGALPPGTIRKDSRDTWDSALMRALNAGLITQDEAGQPETFQRLMAGTNVTAKDDLAAETKHMLAQQEGELIDALKRGETVDEQAFKDFPAAEKFRDYGKTMDNPATVGGLEAYHDGKAWKARKPGGEFKKVEGPIAARLDAAMPGVAEEKVPFSIDKDDFDLLAEFEKQFPEPEPARPKLAKRILEDDRYTEQAKAWAKNQIADERSEDEDREAAHAFVNENGLSVAHAKIKANQTGLKDSQASTAAGYVFHQYQYLTRKAERDGDAQLADDYAKSADDLAAWIKEQQVEGGRLNNSWKNMLTTESWDTRAGQSATFNGMVNRSNEKHPEIKIVEQQLELAQKTIQQVAKEAADKALANEALKATIANRDAEIETMKRRDALLAKQDKAGFESWDRNPARYKSLNDQLDAKWNAPNKLAGKFKDGAKLSIDDSKAMLAVDPAKYLSAEDSEEITSRTQAWIWQQKKAGKEYGFKEWRAWAESEYGKGLFNFDNANDAHKNATRLMGRAATMSEKGKRAPKLETLIRRGIKASGFSINEIVYQTVTQQGATLKTLTERLVNELGYSATDAADLAVKINSEFRNIIGKRGQQMLEAKFRDRGTKPRGRTKNVLDDILKSIRLGALSDADIKAKLYDKYGLTTVSPEAEAKFVELAAKVAEETDKRYNAAKAKGYTDAQIAMQDDSVGMRTAKEASAKFMASQVKHGLNDYAWSWVHFSLLSSPYTWLFNTVANSSQLLGITTARALQGIVKAPFDRGRTLRQLSYGLSEMIGATPGAFAEAYNTMVTGEGVIRGNDKFDSDPSKYNVFESSKFLNKHPVLKAPLVFVRRILQAGDIVSAMQLRELQSAMMTASIAQSEGLTGVALSERVAEMMGHSPLNMKKYESMADAEGLTGINRFRRINQLVENNRAQDIRENASVFSAWHTFNSQMPRGFIGDAAMVLNNFALRNQDHPILGIPARSLGLFVRISANVSNIILDYSPYGFERARRGKVRLSNGKTYEMNDLYEGLRADVVTQAAMGTAMMTTVLLHALSALAKWKEDPDKDKKNPDFSVYGPGPKNAALRQVWMEAGGRPWSIQFGNGNAIPYKWATPLAIPFALGGLWMDGERFKDENEDEQSRVWRMTGGMAVGLLQYIMQQSPMTAMNSAFRAVNGFGGKDEENRFRKYIAGFTGFAIPNFISWIDKSMDPTVYSANDWLSAFTKNIPFVRGNALVPSLNLFGEPIEYAPSERFLGDAKSDTEMMWLTNNNLGIAKPDRQYMVDYKTGKQHEITEEEYYKLIKYFGPRFREALRFAIPRMNNLGHKDKMDHVTKLKADAFEYAKFMLYKETGWQVETKEKAEDFEAWFERKNK